MNAFSTILISKIFMVDRGEYAHCVWSGQDWHIIDKDKPEDFIKMKVHVYASPARAEAALIRGRKRNPHSGIWSNARYMFVSDLRMNRKIWPNVKEGFRNV